MLEKDHWNLSLDRMKSVISCLSVTSATRTRVRAEFLLLANLKGEAKTRSMGLPLVSRGK